MALRKLLATSDISLVQSLRMALDAEDIPAIIANEAMVPLQPVSVHVNDEDFEQAYQILHGLQDTPAGAVPLTIVKTAADAAPARPWLATAIAVSAGYSVIGLVTAAGARQAAPGNGRFWNWAAWGLSLAVFAWHILHEGRRAPARPAAAGHATTAVMLATALLALLAIVHNLGRGALGPGMLAAFLVWPALTGMGSFVVAYVVLAVLAPRRAPE